MTSHHLGQRIAVIVACALGMLLPACASDRAAEHVSSSGDGGTDGCWGSTTRDYPGAIGDGEAWVDHFPDEADAIEYLQETASAPKVGINGPVEPTGMDRLIMESQVAAYAELRRDDERSTEDHAIWTGPHAEVSLERAEHGWRVSTAAAELPPEVCGQAREDRALRHPGSDPEAEAQARQHG